MKKKMMLLMMTLGMLFLLMGCGATKINLNEYLDIDYDGPDGYAEAVFEIDHADMIEDYEEIFGYDEDDLVEKKSGQKFLAKVQEAITGDFNEDKKLSNDDELIFTWELDAKEIEEEFKVKFVYEDVTEIVEDLDEAEEIDAFDGIEIEYYGYSGYGEAEIYSDDVTYPMFSYIYDYEDLEGLANGDTIEVTIDDYNKEEWYRAGIVPESMKKQFTVEGLSEPQYVDAFEGLEVEFYGINGEGEAYISSYDTIYWLFEYSYDYDTTRNLSNGDEILVTLNDYNEEYWYMNGLIPESREKVITVTGLREIETVDVFEDLDIEVYGTSPFGYVYTYYNGDYGYLYFTCDKDYDLSNGDVITITLDDYYVDYLKEYYYVVPSRTSMEYEITGLSYYINSIDSMSEDRWASLIDSERQWIENNVTDDWTNPETLADVQYVGTVLTSYAGTDSWYADDNVATLYFELTVEPEEGDPFKYYYTSMVYELIDDEDDGWGYNYVEHPYGYVGWTYTSGAVIEVNGLKYIGYNTLQEAYVDDPYNTTYQYSSDYIMEYVFEDGYSIW